MKEEVMADLNIQIGSLASLINVDRENVDIWLQEMKAWRIETTACQEAMEACLEKRRPTWKKRTSSKKS
jgi:hypothetical protein